MRKEMLPEPLKPNYFLKASGSKLLTGNILQAKIAIVVYSHSLLLANPVL